MKIIQKMQDELWENIEKIARDKQMDTTQKQEVVRDIVNRHPELQERTTTQYPTLYNPIQTTTTTNNNQDTRPPANITISRKETHATTRKETVDLNELQYNTNPANTIVNTAHQLLSPFWNLLNAIAEVIKTTVSPGRILVLGSVYAALSLWALIWIAQYTTDYHTTRYQNFVIEEKTKNLLLQYQHDSLQIILAKKIKTQKQNITLPPQQTTKP